MAEILLEGRDCETCGTEVRKGALFCYHCGESVAPDVAVTTDTEKEKVSDEWFRDDVTESAEEVEETDDSDTIDETDKPEIVEEETDTPKIVKDAIIEEDAKDEKDESVLEDATVIKKDTDTEKKEKTKLKTAAAMRRKPKRFQKKRVEIVWEEPNSPPNVWFLIATLLFAILAVGLWFVAKYLG